MTIISRYTIKEGKYAGQQVKVLAPVIPTWRERMRIWGFTQDSGMVGTMAGNEAKFYYGDSAYTTTNHSHGTT
jgi:hypothetical protein